MPFFSDADEMTASVARTSNTLSFFRALDPTSKNSGIICCLAPNYAVQGHEMIDLTVDEYIAEAFNNDLDFLSGIYATYNALAGTHYGVIITGGTKGVLDYLILPLVARKLISDSFLDERKNSVLTNVLAWTVSIPLELARFTAAFALTVLLIPVVGLVHLIKDCMSKEEPEIDANNNFSCLN